VIEFFDVAPADDEAFLAVWRAEGGGPLLRALRDDVQPRYVSGVTAPEAGVLLLASFSDEVVERLSARQGFVGARRVGEVVAVHWSSPLMWARAVRADGPFAGRAELYVGCEHVHPAG
jgi:hypothetical protein